MRIAGVDEAGRGPLAGPVVAAAVVFAPRYRNKAITDSKKLSPQIREELYEVIVSRAVSWAIVSVGHRRIDSLNILQATRLAMKLAVERVEADLVLIDGITPINITIPQRTIIGGDLLHLQISAASILAKVWRDRLMEKLSSRYPGYGFERHSGYATELHRDSIKLLGPSRIHRRTFNGVKEYFCLPEANSQPQAGLPA